VRLAARTALSAQAVLVGLAIVLSVMATLVDVIWAQLDRTNYWPVIVLWISAALAYASAFLREAPRLGSLRAWLSAHRGELLGIGLITLMAAGLRFFQLGDVPRVIDGDEGRLGQAALQTNLNPLANPFALFENFGGLYMQAISLAIRLFGPTPFALRLMPAIGGALAVPALYLLSRYLFGSRLALLAATLLAWSHAHVHYSRIVAVAYIQETWLIPLELYFFISGLERRSRARLALAGLILGAHLSVYVSAQIMIAFFAVYLLMALWLCRPLVQNAARALWTFWLGVLITALPQVVYAVQNPEQFFSRLNADGTFQSGWLANTMAQTGQSAVTILAGRVAHVFLTLNHYPAIDFYGVRVPLLDVVTGTFFILGIGYALWRTRDPRYLLLNGYFWSLTVAIGIFAIPESADSYRVLVALPAAILLAAVGFREALVVLGLDAPGRRLARSGLVATVLVAALKLNVRTYVFDFAQRCRFGLDMPTRFASYLGNYLRGFQPDHTVYLLSDENTFYGSHVSVDFLSNDFPVTNVPDPAASLSLRPNMTVIAYPDRMDELRAWAAEHPGGTLRWEYDCDQPMLLAYHMP
jgi:4-amino-4-deoxy-L-arabinose transferase-like glycosyltransferase